MPGNEISMEDAAAFAETFDSPAPAPAAAKEAKAVIEGEVLPPENKKPDPAPEGDDGVDEELPEENAEAEAEAEDEGEDDDTDPEGAPAVEAPQFWDAEAKATFASLSPEAQAVVRAQEDKREAVVAKVKEKAQATTDAAVRDIAAAKGLADRLAAALPDQRKEFDAYFADIDWPAYSRQDPVAAQEDWFKYQQGQDYFNKAETAKAEAEKLARESFARVQVERLQEIAPELASKPENLKILADYLPQTGIPAEALVDATAEELVILNESRMYRAMMAKAAAKPSEPPRQKNPTPPAKVPPQGQGRAPQSSQQREVSRLQNSLAQTRDRATAAELITRQGF